jgi:hypothetical protein
VETIVEGMQAPDLNLNQLLRDIALDWKVQTSRMSGENGI